MASYFRPPSATPSEKHRAIFESKVAPSGGVVTVVKLDFFSEWLDDYTWAQAVISPDDHARADFRRSRTGVNKVHEVELFTEDHGRRAPASRGAEGGQSQRLRVRVQELTPAIPPSPSQNPVFTTDSPSSSATRSHARGVIARSSR